MSHNIVVTSDSCEQLAKKNIGGTQGWPFYNFMEWDKLWGNPIEPDIGTEPKYVIMKGFFAGDYSGLSRIQRMLGDLGHKYNPRCPTAKRVIVLWAGSDVIALHEWKKRMGRYEAQIYRDLRTDRFCHIPVSSKQRRELKKYFDIDACEPLPTPARKLFDRMLLPEKPVVAVYLPTYGISPEFHRHEVLFKVAEEMEDTKFIFYHWLFAVADKGTGKFPDLANVRYRYHCSREQYEDIIEQSSMLLRIPVHDGLSGGAADFLMAGRPVLSCHDMPEWPAVFDESDLKPETVMKAIKRGIEVSEKTREWYLDHFDPEKYKERLAERVRTVWPDVNWSDLVS